MSYRLICFDYDGTAAVGGQFPTQRVRRAVNAAQRAGARVLLATGRSFGSAFRYAEELGLRDAVITWPSGETTTFTPVLKLANSITAPFLSC